MTAAARPRLVVLPGGRAVGGQTVALGRGAPQPHARADRALFATLSFGLLTAAIMVQARWGSVLFGDASSRLTSARLVVSGRDPHLAAIGFVWNPLPTLAAIPLVALGRIWPGIVSDGYAMIAVSCTATATSAVLLNRIMRDLALGRGLRRLLVAAFVLHPMTLLYAINGMSEALFVCTLIFATRHLIRWLDERDVVSLIWTALGLAGAYLCRYEAIAPIGATTAVVAIAVFTATAGPRRVRLNYAVVDALIVAAPALFAFATWALVSWSITGHPFEHFSSQYGNAAQTRLASAGIDDAVGGSRLAYTIEQIFGLAPWLAVAPALAVASRRARRTARELTAPLAVLGSVCAINIAFFALGTTFGVLRFQICAIPLGLLAVAIVLARRPAPQRRVPLAPFAAVAIATVVTATLTMSSPRLAREEAGVLREIRRGRTTELARADQAHREIARYLTVERHQGLILLDHAHGFRIIQHLASLSYVATTTDRDFEAIVSDPVAFGVELIALPEPVGFATTDAINRAFPDFFVTGGGIATIVHDFPGRGSGVRHWRIYRVIPE